MATKIIGEETPESAAIKKHCGNLKNHQNMPKIWFGEEKPCTNFHISL